MSAKTSSLTESNAGGTPEGRARAFPAAGWIFYFAFLPAAFLGIPKTLAYFFHTDSPMAAITSGSMWPALDIGDLVLIEGVGSPKDLKVGDIVVYRSSGGFTIHRIVSIRGNSICVKGDANMTADAPVMYDEVVGRAVTCNGQPVKIPYLGEITILFNRN